ncbi:MAG: hypothetical protein H6719_02370 [Sandaracinaceae bacterium]|nr:hypothetical protein [Sandaracinaceae bacterium]
MRPWLIAGFVNVAVAGVLLGIPYVRGPQRAAEVPARWAAFAACFYDAEPAAQPGLGLPAGERSRYASLVLGAAEDWPERCRPALEAIPAEESMFLFPNIKNAEAQVRASVELMGTEMRTLSERRADGDLHVPDRPARAMQRLRGALAELGLSSGVPGLDADRDAIEMPDDAPLPMASIVPLRVSEGGAWSLAVEEGAVLAATMDSRSVVHVRVSPEGVEQRVTRRPRLVSALLGARRVPWALWTTSAATCAEAVDRCERRTTGLAAFLEDRQTLEPMMWVGAHPLGSPARSVYVGERVAYVLAPDDGGARVMRFELPEPVVRALGEVREADRINASTSWEVDATEASSVAWIDGEPLRLVHAREGRAGVVTLGDEVSEVAIDPPAGHAPQVATCDGWGVLATDRASLAARLDGSASFPVALRVIPPEPARLAVVCRGPRLEIWTLAERALSRAVCTPTQCFEPEVILDGVASFDVVAHRGATVVASTDDVDAGAVRITRLGDDGTRTFVPSPCWSDPTDGLCGEPRLASDGEVLALVTRQEEDLRVVTSRDGVVFGHPEGLEQR